ncbi:peptide/nickel transport system ATP-binding protein/oligopeptide transport system ATP-binding protein [Rhodovulum bhavnagarense]|uniref:Peptide/nickel transport system ATP-binding protein/oligopeptide transport system ATP-binding protein n=1 Tax=Rhodovulum bhavnagarense TaxID=992286 RepID=A0A4R2REP4_9RHOB|nr:ABC transporter ATP-binding protein [Rhodovulum bhavnagarense]TCP60507.1 peptide/nickel transport system ATP-binding protein/oligopeptide transport system ATP-binding protein [Rhodovulum bhavnagarense]
MTDTLIEVRNLSVRFPVTTRKLFRTEVRELAAVDDVSFDIKRGETVGLVGESGSGKTTVGRAILRAIDPSDGEVIFHTHTRDVDVAHAEGEDLRRFRTHMNMIFAEGPVQLSSMAQDRLRLFRSRMSLVFQDPYSSLNPRMTVRDIIAEPLVASGMMKNRAEIDARVREIAARCKLNLEHLRRFPHAFSGGQRQRICIARALVSRPDFVVCDESVSALDVSIQAEIVNLLKDLQDEMGVAFLFIAHDLSVVAQMSHRVAVMYVGKFVEYAPTDRLFFTPRHPYTHALLSAIPQADPDAAFDPIKLEGEIPNPLDAPSGCRFRTRCPHARPECAAREPDWREIAPDHYVACHFAEAFDFTRAQAKAAE